MNEVTGIVPHVLVYSRLLLSLIAYIMRSPRARGTLLRFFFPPPPPPLPPPPPPSPRLLPLLPPLLSLSLSLSIFLLLFHPRNFLSSKSSSASFASFLLPDALLVCRVYSRRQQLTTIRAFIVASMNFHEPRSR